jgi:hypothetical protein
MKHMFVLLSLHPFLHLIYDVIVLPTLLCFMRNKGTLYRAEMLQYLMFHPMKKQKDLPQ